MNGITEVQLKGKTNFKKEISEARQKKDTNLKKKKYLLYGHIVVEWNNNRKYNPKEKF